MNCPIHVVIVLKEFVLKQKMKNLLKSIFVSVDVHFFGDQGGIHVLAALEVRRWSLGAAPTYFAKN